MRTRSETAAETRMCLLDAAADLLDEGGPEAVTLRAVSARAGVSRGAPYGHFSSKQELLSNLALDAWNALADRVETLLSEPEVSEAARLERAMLALVDVGRSQPHRYALMFNTPADHPEAAIAAGRLEHIYHQIVADVVGKEDARRTGALLMSSAHGIAGLERSGHLTKAPWNVDAEELVGLLVSAIQPDDS